MSSRASFIQLLEEIAVDEGFVLTTTSDSWVLRFQASDGRSTFVYGYNFNINGAASQQICGDKSATYNCLKLGEVPAIPHESFLNPADSFVSSYIPSTGSITAAHTYAKSHGFQVVVKPLKGTAGHSVIRSTNAKELEAAILQVWQAEYGVAISPFVEILDEIRVVVLLGEAKLVYRKKRPVLIGDGFKSVQQLMGKAVMQSSNPKRFCEALASMTPNFLKHVPDTGEVVLIEWRHNLGLGAEAEQIESPPAVAVALAAAKALNMNFCSVDVVRLRDESLAVLEVNSGVMMDSFMQSSAENQAVAREIYTTALRRSLEL